LDLPKQGGKNKNEKFLFKVPVRYSSYSSGYKFNIPGLFFKSGRKKIAYYVNPMIPTLHVDKPMKDPMGMD